MSLSKCESTLSFDMIWQQICKCHAITKNLRGLSKARNFNTFSKNKKKTNTVYHGRNRIEYQVRNTVLRIQYDFFHEIRFPVFWSVADSLTKHEHCTLFSTEFRILFLVGSQIIIIIIILIVINVFT